MKKPLGPRSNRTKRAPKLERIYRVLLDHPLKKWSIKGITRETRTEYHWTYDIFKDLEKRGLLYEGMVNDISGLFELWRRRPSSSIQRDYHVQDPEAWLKNISLDHAVTTYYAENRLGQYLLPRTLEIYIHEDDLDKWHDRIMRFGYAGKGNLRLLVPDEHVFWNARSIEGLRIVCLQQLIVDLLREGGIANEAAENLIGRYYGE